MVITHVQGVYSHRNGITGAPFDVVAFRHSEGEGALFLGIVFAAPSHVAVIKGADPSETWRGDHFEEALRQIVIEHHESTFLVAHAEAQAIRQREQQRACGHYDEGGAYCSKCGAQLKGDRT